jgi:hypothetical protein
MFSSYDGPLRSKLALFMIITADFASANTPVTASGNAADQSVVETAEAEVLWSETAVWDDCAGGAPSGIQYDGNAWDVGGGRIWRKLPNRSIDGRA